MDSERERLNHEHDIFAYSNEDVHVEQISRYEDFTTIDWIEDSILERKRRLRTSRAVELSHRGPNGEITLSWLWAQFTKAIVASQTWLVVSLAGVCIGVNAALISIITEWLSDIKMGYCSDGWWLNQQFCCWEIEGDEEGCDSWHPWSTVGLARWLIYVMFAALFSFIASHLVKAFAKYAAGSGISEIKCILAGFIMKGYLGFMTLFIKSITLPLVIASGLSVGKEGPSVHVACCIGYVVSGLFGNFARSQGKLREMVTAASAAGVAVAFGAPIGGVLFSIEEMSHTFSIKTMWRSFLCALVATVTLSAMNPFRTGKLVLFQVTYDRDWHFFEIIFFVILGIFGGLYGALIVKFNLQVAAFRKKHLGKHGIAEAVTLTCLTAMIGYFNRFLRIDMTESLAILFHECDAAGDIDNLCQTSAQWRMVSSLFLATVLRIIFVIISYGCKVPAGIFVPSMAIGATFGRMIGIMVKALYQAYPKSGIFAVCPPDIGCITPGTYAFLGAAAALSGIMRITVTVVVIMFELTGALTYILPTMIVLLVTKAVGDFLGVNGIADEMIRFNGYPFLEKDDHAFHTTVSSVMRTELQTLSASSLRINDIEHKLQQSDVKGFPIVSNEQRRLLLGYIGRNELRYILDRAKRFYNASGSTRCSFYCEPTDHDREDIATLATGPAIGIDDEAFTRVMQESASPEVLELWPWVNQTPLTVSPQLPLEVVMQLFKRMGPRVVLVEHHGKLVGLVTVKDVLRFMATDHTDNHWNSRAGLDDLLEEFYSSFLHVSNRVSSWARLSIGR
ncbi:voltage-gated chloride channel [Pyrrhoderma noxium]|uniref:Chloride channel protein n=1 Tax=Pyrrhoderma noxium TaxID=2282107 RepID=A0A286UGQ9_9AGAM|nr:voltage-gated chloride channel [Pyrrhoderma noxium]